MNTTEVRFCADVPEGSRLARCFIRCDADAACHVRIYVVLFHGIAAFRADTVTMDWPCEAGTKWRNAYPVDVRTGDRVGLCVSGDEGAATVRAEWSFE